MPDQSNLSQKRGPDCPPGNTGDTFVIRDCALVTLATGRRARALEQFRRELREVDAASLYHHFWGSLLQPSFEEREFNNDFAAWVRHGIHDAVLAERLAVLSPVNFSDLEALRQEILELIDQRLDEAEHLYWTRATQPFAFIRSQIVIFNTGRTLGSAAELARAIPKLSTSSIYYHFVDARRRTEEHCDDFSRWLAATGDYPALCARLAEVDPYFGSLSELRDELYGVFRNCFPEA